MVSVQRDTTESAETLLELKKTLYICIANRQEQLPLSLGDVILAA